MSETRARQPPGVDGIINQHDPRRSGAARFNQILAARLGVPLVSVDATEMAGLCRPLVSVKVSELSAVQAQRLAHAVRNRPSWVFLHEYLALRLENELITRADRVLCGNSAIAERVRPLSTGIELLWTPGLILDARPFRDTDLAVLTFGMAHKLRIDLYRRLKQLLDATGRPYAVHLSAAQHGTAIEAEADPVLAELRELFGDAFFALGTLSDVALHNQLLRTKFAALFFEPAARANNTSLAAALEHGAVVLTNLDEHSPPHLRHMETVIDINRCSQLPREPETLERMGRSAARAAEDLSWEALTRRVRGSSG